MVFFIISLINKLPIHLQIKHKLSTQKVKEARKRHDVSKTTEIQTKLFSGPTKKWSKEKVNMYFLIKCIHRYNYGTYYKVTNKIYLNYKNK